MSTALAKSESPKSIERQLAELPKGELVTRLVQAKSIAKKHRIREHAAHGGKVVLGAVLSGVGGGIAGLAQAKMPYIPKTKIRTDLAAGGVLAGLCALNFFGNGPTSQTSLYLNDIAKGLIGAGTAEATKAFLVERGVKVAA